MSELMRLAKRCEQASGPGKALDREIALAVGWVRQSPSEAGRRHPAWFHPDDCRDGKPVLDSLHGTDVWRDPLPYTASIDAAMTLVDARALWAVGCMEAGPFARLCWPMPDGGFGGGYHEASAATVPLALCAAALRARSVQEEGDG